MKRIWKTLAVLCTAFVMMMQSSFASILEGVITPDGSNTISSDIEDEIGNTNKVYCPWFVHPDVHKLTETTYAFRGHYTRRGFILDELYAVSSIQQMYAKIAARDGKKQNPEKETETEVAKASQSVKVKSAPAAAKKAPPVVSPPPVTPPTQTENTNDIVAKIEPTIPSVTFAPAQPSTSPTPAPQVTPPVRVEQIPTLGNTNSLVKMTSSASKENTITSNSVTTTNNLTTPAVKKEPEPEAPQILTPILVSENTPKVLPNESMEPMVWGLIWTLILIGVICALFVGYMLWKIRAELKSLFVHAKRKVATSCRKKFSKWKSQLVLVKGKIVANYRKKFPGKKPKIMPVLTAEQGRRNAKLAGPPPSGQQVHEMFFTQK